jgi:hypothetical protein
MARYSNTRKLIIKTNSKTQKQPNTTSKKQTKTTRPSPSESATAFSLGTIRRGGDGGRWVITHTSKGVPRWTPIASAEINGVRLLTVNHLAKNIGKPVLYYSRMYEDTFPTLADLAKMESTTFTPNGNAQVDKKKTLLEGWLRTQLPAVKPGQFFSLLGDGDFGSMQIDSKHPNIVSDNVMNTECFIKVEK